METAVAVLFDDAEDRFGAIRRAHCDDAADGMPAHVTVVYPFVDSEAIDERVEHDLAAVVAGVPRFEMTLARAARFVADDPLLYLAPDPAEAFVELTRRVVHAFPDYPPYGGTHDEVIPHLTLARGDAALLDRLEHEVMPELPLRTHVECVWLVEHAPRGWRRRRAFALGTN